MASFGLVVELPRYKDEKGFFKTVSIPWAEEYERMTILLEKKQGYDYVSILSEEGTGIVIGVIEGRKREVKQNEALRKSKWLFLKDKASLTDEQYFRFEAINNSNVEKRCQTRSNQRGQ